jgi:hypothetical protein
MFSGLLTARRPRKAEVSEPMTVWLRRFTHLGIISEPPLAGNASSGIMLKPLPLPLVPVKPIRPVNRLGSGIGLTVTIQHNHRWTQIDTDENRSEPHFSIPRIRSPDSDPK